jgi:hypothetical protein
MAETCPFLKVASRAKKVTRAVPEIQFHLRAA